MTRTIPTPQGPTVVRLNKLGRRPSHIAEDVLVTLPSRQLRAPLASMVGVAELIASGDLTTDQSQLYAAILLREGRRLTGMVQAALALQSLETRNRELDRTPTDLGSLIQRAVRAAGADDERPIAVDVPETLPLVAVDPEAILEVLANFLSNARGFSPCGGVITVAARTAGDMVEVSIADQGVGLTADDLPKLFRKFFRADPRLRPGLGLGLAINHRIIEAHGGRIAAESSGPGKGARFVFTLQPAPLDAKPSDVLVVEDDASFARLMKREFAASGLSTLRAADAESAERILAYMSPRGILLDLSLPGIQGDELLAWMATGHGQPLPVVVMTMKDLLPAEISALESAGATAVLPKGAGAPQAAVTLIADKLGPRPGAA